MTKAKHKRKRGRPIGGKHAEVMREYWRNMQRIHRAIQQDLKKAKKVK